MLDPVRTRPSRSHDRRDCPERGDHGSTRGRIPARSSHRVRRSRLAGSVRAAEGSIGCPRCRSGFGLVQPERAGSPVAADARSVCDPRVSEVMLQQTQVVRVVPRYLEWLERWPTAEALAGAAPADVIRAWSGLGYNRRAVNLHRCAQAVAARGGFPREPEELRKLPGIGPYTAAAIACFAFGAQIAAPDTNALRVVERAFPGADVEPPPGRAYEWNQALFDLGREVCIARRPRCEAVPAGRRLPVPRADVSRRSGASRASRARSASGGRGSCARSRPPERCPRASATPRRWSPSSATVWRRSRPERPACRVRPAWRRARRAPPARAARRRARSPRAAPGPCG